MCFARLLTKKIRGQEFDEDDWRDCTEIAIATMMWLYANTDSVDAQTSLHQADLLSPSRKKKQAQAKR
jgi:hypothetical protein